MLPNSFEEFTDIYIVSPLMEADLYKIIKSSQPLSIHHVQYLLYQILRGLKYIHSAGIIHRDLVIACNKKPRNILVNSDSDLKICDFGLARLKTLKLNTVNGMTPYIVSRWYRAPEILLRMSDYGPEVDVWAAGCIFAELVTRSTLFLGHYSICLLKQQRTNCKKFSSSWVAHPKSLWRRYPIRRNFSS